MKLLSSHMFAFYKRQRGRGQNQPGFLEVVALGGAMVLGLLASVVLLSLNSAREKSRDAKRVADMRQIAAALELYYNDANQYPDKLVSITPAYIGLVPTPPTPADGSCTEQQNNYVYIKIGKDSYQVSFCLGTATGGYSAGQHILSQAGIN